MSVFFFLQQHEVWVDFLTFCSLGQLQVEDFLLQHPCAWAGQCQSSRTMLPWWKAVPQCLFEAIKPSLKSRSETLGLPFLILNLKVAAKGSVLRAWAGFFFPALSSGFSWIPGSFSTNPKLCFLRLPSLPNDSFACSKVELSRSPPAPRERSWSAQPTQIQPSWLYFSA